MAPPYDRRVFLKLEGIEDQLAVFTKLSVNTVVYDRSGMCFKIVSVDKQGRRFAKWRNGMIGRFGGEVVQVTRAMLRGFRVLPLRRLRKRQSYQRWVSGGTAQAALGLQ